MEILGIRRRIRQILRDAREADQLRVQLAGCSVAALGGTNPKHVAVQGQWGWSPSYQDVLELRRRYDRLRMACESIQGRTFAQAYYLVETALHEDRRAREKIGT